MQTAAAFDPIQVEVWRHLFSAIAEEMGATLQRTAYSPNIKERLDHSCALFDAEGRLLAQAAHIPVHLGAMPLMLQRLRHAVPWTPGVMWMCNDPRWGGTHLPDITLVAPVYAPTSKTSPETPPRRRSQPAHIRQHRNTTTLLGFVAGRAHHADIGGLSPGSLPLSTEPFHEGLIIPPVALMEQGRVRDDVLNLLCANSRTPAERRGDIAAQIAANQTGIRRFQELVQQYGLDLFAHRVEETIAYADVAVRRAIAGLQPGVYHASDTLEGDGAGSGPIPIAVTITVRSSGSISFDFTDSAPQVKGALNATEAITRSACYYLVRCLVEEEIPTNQGCFAPVDVIAPEGTIVNARFPAAVAAGNVETSQRIVDVLLRALQPAAPDRIPAASQGTMNNVTVGGYDPFRHRWYAYYETLAGGAGASSHGPGVSAIHTHMTNTRNTPIESLESHYPLRVLEYAIAEGTGGDGRYRGGDGLIRSLQLLADARITLLTERRAAGPWGAAGGLPGMPGENLLRLPDGTERRLGAQWSGDCPAGSILTIRTPGGGGWGTPK